MLPPGFEPESSDRKSEMIGRTTPQEPNHMTKNKMPLFKGFEKKERKKKKKSINYTNFSQENPSRPK
jgi:hypothetical protein